MEKENDDWFHEEYEETATGWSRPFLEDVWNPIPSRSSIGFCSRGRQRNSQWIE